MARRRTLWLTPLILAVIVFAYLRTRGPAPPAPLPPGTWAFAVVGDAPYYFHEELQFRNVLKDLDAHDLRFVIHVGDIWWRPCSDAKYREAKGWFGEQRHRVYYTPGDNEWVDCWEPRVGGYVPLDRLAQLRRTFYDDAGVTRQPGYPENMRWREGNLVFATMHIPGSSNATRKFPARTAADDEEVRQRTAASIAWMRETFAQAKDASGVVLALHAAMWYDEPQWIAPYAPVVAAMDEEVVRFGKPVLLVNGDDHEYLVDNPLKRPNFTRMQVPGSPIVGWVRVVVRPGPPPQFTFSQRVQPDWKYW